MEYSNGVRVTPEEDVRRQRSFGAYIFKKLIEHHVDGYLQSTPSLKPVHRMKERLSYLDVKVKKGYKFKFEYFYVGNHISIRVENPYKIRNKFILQMDSEGMGLSKIEGTVLHLGCNVTKKAGLDSYYASKGKSVKLVGHYRISPSLILSLSGISGLSGNIETDGFKKKRKRV